MEPLKLMYNNDRLAELGRLLQKEYKAFDQKLWMAHFETKEWKNAELKQRVTAVAQAMHAVLPKEYHRAIDIMKPVSTHLNYGFFGVIFSEFVSLYGRSHWEKSMEALAVFTCTSTAEFAIRYFFLDDPERALKQMEKWSRDKNFHLRRLSSEGSRPRLPWGMKLQWCIDDPKRTFTILDRLKSDSELYVRKSVANHLNDISKDHPEVALTIAEAWKGHSTHTDWIIRHGLRGLLKAGNTRALALMGQAASKNIQIKAFGLAKTKLSLGDTLQLKIELEHTGTKEENLRLEYAIDYIKSTGKTGRKVFQWSVKPLKPGRHQMVKHQALVNMTTRVHYSGRHTVHAIVNGELRECVYFDLHVN